MFLYNYFNKRLFQTFTALVKTLTTPGGSQFAASVIKKIYAILITAILTDTYGFYLLF